MAQDRSLLERLLDQVASRQDALRADLNDFRVEVRADIEDIRRQVNDMRAAVAQAGTRSADVEAPEDVKLFGAGLGKWTALFSAASGLAAVAAAILGRAP